MVACGQGREDALQAKKDNASFNLNIEKDCDVSLGMAIFKPAVKLKSY
jgi:hypothetical protein